MLLKTHKCYDDKNRLCKIIFSIDRGCSNGLINFAHETCVGYDIRTDRWHGDEINSDGWVTLDEDDVTDIVHEYDLEKRVKEVENDE